MNVRKPRFRRISDKKDNNEKGTKRTSNSGSGEKPFQRKKSVERSKSKKHILESKEIKEILTSNSEKKCLLKGFVGNEFKSKEKEKM